MLLPDVVQDRRARSAFTQSPADAIWHKLLETSLGRGGTFPIAATAERCAMSVHACRSSAPGRDIFTIADMLLIIAAEEDSAINPKILEGLFDLTAAEAAVARELVHAQRHRQIRGVAMDTVRGQLRLIFEKAGVGKWISSTCFQDEQKKQPNFSLMKQFARCPQKSQ
ncbi:hypothetical protein [Mesorhizobium sp. M0323]|uniref:helix-turn-helix transcriptional regulator n=1 Tax=Mesorhizobium sp. M0323 TaxID=2956938 RepID=UPI00333C5C64